jgi:hypothetical protein
MQGAMKCLLDILWKAEEMVNVTDPDTLIMNHSRCASDTIALSQEMGSPKDRREESLASSGKERTLPPAILILLTEIPNYSPHFGQGFKLRDFHINLLGRRWLYIAHVGPNM